MVIERQTNSLHFFTKKFELEQKRWACLLFGIYLLSVFTITKMLELIIMKYFVEIILFSEKTRYLCKG